MLEHHKDCNCTLCEQNKQKKVPLIDMSKGCRLFFGDPEQTIYISPDATRVMVLKLAQSLNLINSPVYTDSTEKAQQVNNELEKSETTKEAEGQEITDDETDKTSET